MVSVRLFFGLVFVDLLLTYNVSEHDLHACLCATCLTAFSPLAICEVSPLTPWECGLLVRRAINLSHVLGMLFIART